MLKSKLIDILKSFSYREINRFSEFLNSPFHNKNKKAVILFNILSQFHPDYNSKKLTKEYIFKLIYSDNKENPEYNDASLRNLFSDLLILSEKFLAYLNFEKRKFQFSEKLLVELAERKLPALFDKNLKSAEDLYIKSSFHDEEDYLNKFVLEELKSSSSQFFDNLKFYKSDHILKASDYLTYFYLIRIFKMINFLEFQKQYNIKSEITIAEIIINEINANDVLNKVKEKSERDYQILSVYFSMFYSLKNPDNDSYYFEFKNNLTKYDFLFPPLEQYGLYVCLTNCCIQKIDRGRYNFHAECFKVYKIILEKKLFDSYPGFFSMTTFTAIVKTGIESGEYEEVEKFTFEYSGKLNPLHKNDALNYSMALVSFSRKQFSKTLEYVSLTNVEFTNFKYHLKIIMLKSLFELSDYETLYYIADSFAHFLSKNKMVSENYKAAFSNFIKSLDLLVKYKCEKDKKYLDKLNIFISEKSFAGKKWIIDKLNELNPC